jgi:hypothetical protein
MMMMMIIIIIILRRNVTLCTIHFGCPPYHNLTENLFHDISFVTSRKSKFPKTYITATYAQLHDDSGKSRKSFSILNIGARWRLVSNSPSRQFTDHVLH